MEEAGEGAVGDQASPRVYSRFVIGYVALSIAHVIAVACDPKAKLISSYPIFLLVIGLSITALIWRFRLSDPATSVQWGILIVAVFFVAMSNLINLIRALSGDYNLVPALSICCDALYAALLILSCSTTFNLKKVRVTNIIDGVMAVALTALFFVRILSITSIAGTGNTNDIMFIIRMFDVLGVFVILCASVRLVGAEEISWRHFFFVLAAFVLTSTLCAAVRNRLLVTHMSSFDELLMLPQFVVLGLLSLRRLPDFLNRFRPRPYTTYVAASLSPLFLGLGVLGISISIWKAHPALGELGVSIAVIAYGIRNVITQSEQMSLERSMLALQTELQGLVVTDPLTRIANRRRFDEALELEWNRGMRGKHSLSLLLIDVDHFKKLNDRYGHRYGDQCLVDVAAALHSTLTRSGDLVARYGGEEFAVILPATDSKGAQLVATRLLEAIRSLQLRNETSMGQFVTISVGIAIHQFPEPGSPGALVEAADRALYQAKSNGRNRIELPVSPTPAE
jgi:diguanylate cyclase (GGDEF)-like protein